MEKQKDKPKAKKKVQLDNNSDIKMTWKDTIAFIIALISVIGPYFILVFAIMLVLMLLFKFL